MTSYLDSRRQCTTVAGCKSDLGKVMYEIAQGAIVDPLLYILYANDVFQEIEDCKSILLYADDTLILSKGANINECIHHGQEMLDKVIYWCDLNKLTINVKKDQVYAYQVKE